MEISRKKIQPLWVLASSLILVACSGEEDSSQNTAQRTLAADVAQVTEVAGKADDCYQRDLLSDDLLIAVNAARAEAQVCRGVPHPAVSPLVENLRLQNAAVTHSDDMALLNFFSHVGSNGLSGGARADAEGYPWFRIGENLAAGYSSPDEVVDGWLASSDGHCENLMDPLMTEMGGSCKTGGLLNVYDNYWTVLLGSTE